MERRERRCLPVIESLEHREVLSHTRLLAVVAHSVPSPRPPQVTAVSQINEAFDTFRTDYTATRSVYLKALLSGSAADPTKPTPELLAFQSYTTNRVKALGQQLTGIFSLSTVGNQAHQKTSTQFKNLQNVVRYQVSGQSPKGTFYPSTLGNSLLSTIPNAGSSESVVQMDVLSQDQAIESTRISVVNSFQVQKQVKTH